MRTMLALFLSLILSLASQSEAVARSEMAGATDQVLCGALGATHVVLDAAGHAIHGRPCTHCLAAAVVADVSAPVTMPLAPITRSLRLALPRALHAVALRVLSPTARAPPVLLA